MSKLDVMFRAELARMHHGDDDDDGAGAGHGDAFVEFQYPATSLFDSDSFDHVATTSELDALSCGLGNSPSPSTGGSSFSEHIDPPHPPSSLTSPSSKPCTPPSTSNGFEIFPTYRAATDTGSPLHSETNMNLDSFNNTNMIHSSSRMLLPTLHYTYPPRTVHMSDVTMGDPHSQLMIQRADMGSAAGVSYTQRINGEQHEGEAMALDSDDAELSYPSDSEYIPTHSGGVVSPSALLSSSNHSGRDADGDADGTIRPSRRKPRAMTKVPIPIPNLTKKSRGRKVPVSNGGEPIYAHSKDKTKKGVRTYTCHVAGCSKCFVRGEHLKRHIRSIHTDEKPWQCTYAGCDRAFSRRDNLNQHLRVHSLSEETSRASPTM